MLSNLRTTAMVLIIIVDAILFGHVVTILHVPQPLITLIFFSLHPILGPFFKK